MMMKIYGFKKICNALKYGIEIEFAYKGIIYSILNFNEGESCWYFLCDELEIDFEICRFEEIDFLINWLSNYKIEDFTIKEIFDKGIYDEGSISSSVAIENIT